MISIPAKAALTESIRLSTALLSLAAMNLEWDMPNASFRIPSEKKCLYIKCKDANIN